MARKRKEPEPDLETLFAILYSKVDASSQSDSIRSFLGRVKEEMEGSSASASGDVNRTAKSYTLEDAVSDFNLKYNLQFGHTGPHFWKIEALAEVTAMEPSKCLVVFLEAYTSIYDRSSKAACRLAVDLLLCDCIAQMRGEPQPTGDEFRPSTPRPSQQIKVFCEISFSHKINSKSVIVGGRVTHGIGFSFASKPSNQRFHSLLLCVESKVDGILVNALGQLVVFLGSLRQSRIDRGKPDSSVYGVATDGFLYIFVTITHEGVLKKSKQFDVNGELAIVLGCLRFILEKAISMTPNASPTQGVQEVNEVDDTDTIFTVHSREEDDDSDDEAE